MYIIVLCLFHRMLLYVYYIGLLKRFREYSIIRRYTNIVYYIVYYMYADDTTLYCNVDSGHTLNTMINDKLNKISRWLAANKISLNVRKTKYMFFFSYDLGKIVGKSLLELINLAKKRDVWTKLCAHSNLRLRI